MYFLECRPSKVKEQLRDSGVSSSMVLSDDPKTAKEQRIRDMQKYAVEKRKQRAWERINEAIENEDEDVLERMEQFNKK